MSTTALALPASSHRGSLALCGGRSHHGALCLVSKIVCLGSRLPGLAYTLWLTIAGSCVYNLTSLTMLIIITITISPSHTITPISQELNSQTWTLDRLWGDLNL